MTATICPGPGTNEAPLARASATMLDEVAVGGLNVGSPTGIGPPMKFQIAS